MAKKSKKTATAKKRPAATVAKSPQSPPVPQKKIGQFWKRTKHPVRLPSAWRVAKTATYTLKAHWRLFGAIMLIYGALSLVLVHGFAGTTNVAELKTQLQDAFSGQFGALASSLGVFVTLVGTSGGGSTESAGVYQLFLTLMASLAVIWALREVLSGKAIRARDAYYRGMYPLVPFMLVLVVCGLQLLPLVIGSSLYSLVVSGGIAVHAIEKIGWAVLYAGLALWSLYMITSSLFALYVVTLPGMTPLKALRSGRQLTRNRRWTVMRKLLALPLLLGVIGAIVTVPVIVVAAPLAQWVYFVLSILALAAAHSYMYTLYRELLNE